LWKNWKHLIQFLKIMIIFSTHSTIIYILVDQFFENFEVSKNVI